MQESPIHNPHSTQIDAYAEHRKIVEKVNNGSESLNKRLESINNLEKQIQGGLADLPEIKGPDETNQESMSPEEINQEIISIDQGPQEVNTPLTLNQYGEEAVQKTEKQSEMGRLLEDSFDAVELLFRPLTFLGSGLAPIAKPSQAESFTQRVGEDFKTTVIEMKNRLFPDMNPNAEPPESYGMLLAESLVPNASDSTKQLVGTTLDFVSDPAITLGLPFAKVIQKGLLKARQSEVVSEGVQSFRGVVQEGIAELFAGGGSANIDPKELGRIGQLAQKIDSGEASPEDLIDFNRLLDENADLMKGSVSDELKELQELQGTLSSKFGDPSAPVFTIERTPSTEEIAKSINTNYAPVNVNLNYSKLNGEEDVNQMLQDITNGYKERFRAAVGNQANSETVELSQDQQLSDLLGKKTYHFTAEEAYALRQTLLASGASLVKLAKRTELPTASDVDHIAFNKALAVHLLIHEKVLGVKGQAGRMLQSFNIPADGGLKDINKQLNQLATIGKMDSKSKTILKKMLATTTPTEASKIVANTKGGKLTASLFEIFTNAILSGPVTHSVNISSNALNLAWAPTQSFIEGMSAAARLDFRESYAKNMETAARLTGLAQGMSDAFRHAMRFTRMGKTWEDLNIPTDMRGQSEIEGYRYRKAITSESLEINGPLASFVDFMGKFVRIPGAALVEEDIAFKIIHYRMETNAQAAYKAASTQGSAKEKLLVYNALRNNPNRHMVEQSVDAAEHYTFTKNLGEVGTRFNKVISSNYATKFAIPFFRTPTNIAKQGVRNSVWGNVYKDVLSGDVLLKGPKGDAARAKIVMGSAVPFAAMNMLDDRITGRIDPATPEGRFKISQGMSPYSIKIGDTWHSYEKIEPLRSILGMVVNTKEAMHNVRAIDPVTGEENPVYTDLVTNITGAFINTIGDTYMIEAVGGMMDIIDGVSTGNPDYAFNKLQQISANMIVPQFMSQVNREHFDQNMRLATTYLEQIKRRIPNLAPMGVEGSEALPMMYTIWGDPQLYPEGLGPDIISSIRTRTKEPDWVDKELVRLIDDYNLAIPNDPPRDITVSGAGLGIDIKLELTSKQRAQFQVLRGKGIEGGPSLKEVFVEMFTDSGYQAASDIDKRNQAAQRFSEATAIAKEYLFNNDPMLQEQFEKKKAAFLRQRQRTQQ